VKNLPAVLAPFIRSDAIGAILSEVFLHPSTDFTLAELARRTGTLPAVVHKEVSRLVDGQVLLDRREGKNRLVHVNQAHPLYAPMGEIIATTYGPVPVLRDLLSGLDGVVEAFIFGSWAARRAGQAGGFPRDIDVMVIGELSVDDLLAVQAEAHEQLGLEVNIHRSSLQDWRDRSDNPFLTEVASRPVVELLRKEGANAVGTE